MPNEVNFLSPKVNSRDRDLMGFDDCVTDMNIMIEDHWILAHIMQKWVDSTYSKRIFGVYRW